MIRGFSKLGQFVPKAGKLRVLQRWRLMCESKSDLALMRVTAKQYSSSASIQGGVVTQVIGAVVDVQVGDSVRRLQVFVVSDGRVMCRVRCVCSSMDLFLLF